VAELGEGGTLEADQRLGAHDQLPPALDAGEVGDAIVRPAEVIFGMFEPVLTPRAQPERIAHCLLDRAEQIGHEVPGRLRRQRRGIGGELFPAHRVAGAIDRLAEEPLLAAAVGEDTVEGAPPRLADALAWQHPDAVIRAQGHHVLQVQPV
jgi:hypothetical protein